MTKRMGKNEVRDLLEIRSSAIDLNEYLEAHSNLAHLSVRQRGKSITLVIGDGKDAFPCARFTHLGGDDWQLSFPTWNARKWERTPFIGTVGDLVETILESFPDRLAE